MIPRDFITEWRSEAPWVQDFQVEQDLVISKALAFRGGTALYKLFLKPAARYSEDIDLVQVTPEPAGDVMDALHEVFDPWLGTPRYKQTEGRVTFSYRFKSEETPPIPLKLKVEINTREHFSVYGIKAVPFTVTSRWFEGACDISSYSLEELLGTKMRALYQRRKGRDLFDLAVALDRASPDEERIIGAFLAYMDHGGHHITKTQFADNLAAKMANKEFSADIGPLLAHGEEWDGATMAEAVSDALIERLPDG